MAPHHERSSSGSNDPIGDLEARVERLTRSCAMEVGSVRVIVTASLSCQHRLSVCSVKLWSVIGLFTGL